MSQFNANGGNINDPIIAVVSPEVAAMRASARSAEKHGRIDGAKADTLDRVSFLARHGAGMPDTYKIKRIIEILDELQGNLQRIETEYFNA